MGIRLALGARSGELVAMITRRGLVLSAMGLALGIPLALGIHHGVLSALNLFEANIGYGMAMTAGGLLVGVAILAIYLPARSVA